MLHAIPKLKIHNLWLGCWVLCCVSLVKKLSEEDCMEAREGRIKEDDYVCVARDVCGK